MSFDEVLSASDFVTVCCLLTDETRHLINAAAFARMKPTAYYLNVGRGPIHDEVALAAALRAGTIAGAGLDVTEREPIDNDSPLIGMGNTIITPHALCWTDECFEDIARTALGSIVDEPFSCLAAVFGCFSPSSANSREPSLSPGRATLPNRIRAALLMLFSSRVLQVSLFLREHALAASRWHVGQARRRVQ